MDNIFSRTELLLGKEAMEKLKKSRIAVFGVGGVGGYIVEALVRSGAGTIDVFDNDTISESNLNRQIIATQESIGKYKVDVIKERAASINPDVVINSHRCFYMPDNADNFDFSEYDYIADAIDTVTAKIEIIMRAKKSGVPVISSMGTGNKLNPAMLEVSDIYKTSVCPLARVMRNELKKRGIKKLKVVYSKEIPQKTGAINEETGKAIPGSTAFVPPVAGLIIASEIVKEIIKE